MSRNWEFLTKEQAEKADVLWEEYNLDKMRGCEGAWDGGYTQIWSPNCIQLDGNYTLENLKAFVHILEELQKD